MEASPRSAARFAAWRAASACCATFGPAALDPLRANILATRVTASKGETLAAGSEGSGFAATAAATAASMRVSWPDSAAAAKTAPESSTPSGCSRPGQG
jgi:hypothetical protein